MRPRGQTIASNNRRQRSSSSNAAIMSPTVVIPARISRTPLAMTASRYNGSDHCGEPAKVQGLLSLVDKGGVVRLTTDALPSTGLRCPTGPCGAECGPHGRAAALTVNATEEGRV